MDGKDQECKLLKTPQTSTIETVLPNVSYLRNFAEATVLFCTVPNYSALRQNVLYNKILDVRGMRCEMRLLKSRQKLFLCVHSETFPQKVAEFLLVDEKDGNSLKCVAKELAEGYYVGEFQSAEYAGSKYLRNDILSVAFKYFTPQSTFYQDTLSEAAEPLTDVRELCSDYRRVFMTGLHGDFTIQASGYKFTTHRFILAAHSEFFDELFQKDPNAKEFICSDDVQPDIMHKTLLYIYSGELEVTNLKLVLFVSDLAVRFSIRALCRKCGRYFLRCIEETCRRANGNNRTYSGGREKLDIDFMRIICEEAFRYKRLEVFAQKCARYLKRNLEKFLHLETSLSTRKYTVKMDDIIELWRLTHVRKLKDIRNQCSMILRRCTVDPLFFDAYVKTGEEMRVNLNGVLRVAEFAQKVRSAVLSKKCVDYIFDRFEVHQQTDNLTSEEEISMQAISRILNIALKNHRIGSALVDKCIVYCLNFMQSRKNTLFPIKDLTSLIEVAYVAKKLEKNDFLAECVLFLKKYCQYFNDTYLHIKGGNSLVCFILSTIKLHELSLDESLSRSYLEICKKIVQNNNLSVDTQDALRENIDLFKYLLRLSDKLKRIKPKMDCGEISKKECDKYSTKDWAAFKTHCASYIEKLTDACHNLAMKEIFNDNTLKYIKYLFKFARKSTSFQKKLNGILVQQINLCSEESDCSREDHKLDSLITICNITRKLKMIDISKKCAEILEYRIQKLNSSIRRKHNNPGKKQQQNMFETSCIESVVKTYKVFSKFHQRIYIDKQTNETDEKSLEQKQSDSNVVAAINRTQGAQKCDKEHRKFPYEEKRVRALLSQCEDFFDFVLSKTRDSDASEPDKVRVMKCAVEICDLTLYHFESQQHLSHHLSKYGTRCRNIRLRRECLKFMAENLANHPYRSLAEPSQELLTRFMTKLYVLACELRIYIPGEKEIMTNKDKRSQFPETGELMRQKFEEREECDVRELLKWWEKFFGKIREMDISKVPEEIRKDCVARGMKLFKFACDESQPEQKLIKDVFSNYMFLSGSTASVGREENVGFDDACKIIEFAYTTKTEDLQNKCIESYFYQFTNRKNWAQLYDLADKLRSHSLKNVAMQNRKL